MSDTTWFAGDKICCGRRIKSLSVSPTLQRQLSNSRKRRNGTEDTEIYCGEKMDISQLEHEGGNIKENYMKFYKAGGNALLAEVSHCELSHFSRSP